MKTLFMKKLVPGALLLLGSLFALQAQNYTMLRSQIAGGGNTATNLIGYSLSSTIGQLGAEGVLSNGSAGGYTITGGFWAGSSEVTNEGCIQFSNVSNLILSSCGNCVPVYYPVSVTDACCTNGSVTLTFIPTNGACFSPGTTTVTGTAADGCGNSNTCSFTVTILQNTNPPVVLSVPETIYVCRTTNGCGRMLDYTEQVVVSNGSVSMQSIAPGSLVCMNTNVIFTVTNSCGYTTNVSAAVTLESCTNCVPPPSGMVDWWPGDGNALDIVGGVNGSSSGNVGYAQGMVADAFSFDGSGGYVYTPAVTAQLSAGTVDFWFNVNTWNWSAAPNGTYFWANSQYLPNSANSWDGISLGNHPANTTTGELLFGIWGESSSSAPDGWNWAHSGVVPQPGTWYHVAGTWGPNGIDIYVNGVLTGSNPYTGPIQNILQYNLIGRSSWPQSQIDGLIDEVEIFNRALSQSEIDAIYAAGPAGKCKPTQTNSCLSIQCSNITVTTCSNCTTAPFRARAVDTCCSNVTLEYFPNSNTCFTVNTTNPVQVVAFDSCSNAVTNYFTVTVLPGNCGNCTNGCIRFFNATNLMATSCGGCATVIYPLTALDTCCTNSAVTLTFNPSNGTCFYPGTTEVTCTASDTCGDCNSTNFTVTVIANTNPPVIECPSNIVVTTDCQNAQVYYTVIASSEACGNVTVTENLPPGSFFPVGTNLVTVLATDCCGNSRPCSFTVTVIQASSCVAGVTWIEQTNDDTVGWQSLASSSDGSRLVAAVPYASGGTGGGIYTSADYGVTWTAQNSGNHTWLSVASSSDGSKLVAVTSPGQIYTSTDYGMNWAAQNSTQQYWQRVASSADGSRLVAVVNGFSPGGQIYTSTDYGTNWTAQNSPTLLWQAVASSSDGSKLVASGATTVGGSTTGYLYTSVNYGTNWTVQYTSNGGIFPSVASSSDGSKLVAVAYGGIFTSANYGTNWTEQNVGSNTSTWNAVASSSDGSKLEAVQGMGNQGIGTQIYISSDFGVTWTPEASNQDWDRVVSSADGTKLAAMVAAGAIYTSDCTPTTCCVPPPTNMVLWLPFDETNGNLSANLASPEDYGTQVGHPTPLLGSYVDNSLMFTGTNYVTVSNYDAIEIGSNDLTIDAWINLSSAQWVTNAILTKGAYTTNGGYDSGYGLALVTASSFNGLEFIMRDQPHSIYSFYRSTGPISTQQWHFVAVSVSQSQGQGFFYVDGALAGTFNPAPANLANTDPLLVGNGSSFPSYNWMGALDEVEVYNRALSSNELYSIYSAGTAGKCKPCCYLKILTISKVTKTTVEVNWGGCGILQQAPTVLGPWTPVQNAASPYVISITNSQGYFKLDCPFNP